MNFENVDVFKSKFERVVFELFISVHYKDNNIWLMIKRLKYAMITYDDLKNISMYNSSNYIP